MSNLNLWNSVNKTNTDYLKGGQQGLSSIDSYYMFEQATKAFGVCGIGWGYEILSEEYREGGDIIFKGTGSATYEQGQNLGKEINHILKVRFWFELDGKKGELCQYGVTRAVYGSKWGVSTDEEAPKKSLTDAIKKCLSMLGFCADVYMGKFEDSEYRKGAEARSEIEKDEQSSEAVSKAREDIGAWVKKEIEACKKLLPANENGFKAAMKATKSKLVTRCQAAGIHPSSFTNRLDEIALEELSKLHKEVSNAS